MRRCITNYVPVISKETHITHGNGVHVADAGTRWCCIGRELCVCIDALRTMCTCYFQEDVHIRRDAVHATDEAKCSWFINHELCVCVDKLRTMHLSCPRKHASYTKMECMLQIWVRAVCTNHELCVCVDGVRIMYLLFQRKHASHTKMECIFQMWVCTAGV